ncbi:MAG TPA: LPS export ABC transporter permease LptG [Gammaproteobacteria bacterium]|nr:LPS export ABC transporter permease LptG [Gammaproteobacteria bacterium]
MMIQLQTYISKTLFLTTIPIILLILGVDFLFGLVHELGGVGQGGYTSWNALVYVAMTLPRRLYELFPMTSLVGVLLGLGLLASHSELIVMRASGVSVLRITSFVFQFALVIALFMALIGEYVAPRAEYWAENYKVEARSQGQALLTVQGLWVREGNHFIHIAKLQPDGHLVGVTDYALTDAFKLSSITHMQEAAQNGEQWQLHDLKRSHISPDKVTTEYEANATRSQLLDPQILTIAFLPPEDLSLRGLYQYAQYMQANGLDNKLYLLNFWKKALQPLAVIVMMLLSVPFIFGPLRQASMGLRLLAGILTGFSFYVISEIFGPLAMVYHLPPFVAALSPILIFGLLGFMLGTRKNY